MPPIFWIFANDIGAEIANHIQRLCISDDPTNILDIPISADIPVPVFVVFHSVNIFI